MTVEADVQLLKEQVGRLQTAFNFDVRPVLPDRVVLPHDVTCWNGPSNATPNLLYGMKPQTSPAGDDALQFPVAAGAWYGFRFFVVYDTGSQLTGSRLTIGGPSDPGNLMYYRSQYGLTGLSVTVNENLTSFETPANCNAGSPGNIGNIGVIEGVLNLAVAGFVIGEIALSVGSAVKRPVIRRPSSVDWWLLS